MYKKKCEISVSDLTKQNMRASPKTLGLPELITSPDSADSNALQPVTLNTDHADTDGSHFEFRSC